MIASHLRAIPSVEKLLQALGPLDLPRPAATAVIRRELAALRASKSEDPQRFDAVFARVRGAVDRLLATRLRPVINGTGVIVHTNLGRSPLATGALAALAAVGADYNNLEYDLAAGERGNRGSYVEHNLALLCGGQAATVVNNCAAALVLMLRHFTRREGRKEVVISRGELVQIGGGFRIPEILEASGARLREVGTTNRTTLEDYAAAIRPETALLLKVHRSNFFVGGFEESADPAALAVLARRRRVPFVEDLGSGALVPTEKHASIEHERTPSEALRDGIDLVCFSGDKLLGGPQAGLIAGRATLVAALKRDPFFRALRCDKLILAGMQATVDLYLHGREADSIPTLQMLRIPLETLRERAAKIVAALGTSAIESRVSDARAKIGGGTLPRSELPSVTVDLRPSRMPVDLQPSTMPVADFAARLRAASPPIIGYVSAGWYRLDLRTVFAHQDALIIEAVRALFPPVVSVPSSL